MVRASLYPVKSTHAKGPTSQLLAMTAWPVLMFLSGVFFPVEGLPSWMNVLVKINPAIYGIAPIRQAVLGAAPDSPFSISVLGHTMSIWDNIIVMAVFGIVMAILAVWSFGSQE